MNTTGYKRVNVTRRSINAVARIQDALARGQRVMAKAGNWFEVASFREETTSFGYQFWYATSKSKGVEHHVTSFTWRERETR